MFLETIPARLHVGSIRNSSLNRVLPQRVMTLYFPTMNVSCQFAFFLASSDFSDTLSVKASLKPHLMPHLKRYLKRHLKTFPLPPRTMRTHCVRISYRTCAGNCFIYRRSINTFLLHERNRQQVLRCLKHAVYISHRC
jgi:hypothetical protein